MKNILIVTIIMYLSFGFVFALNNYLLDLRTFKCGDITMWTGSFENPDPAQCVRRGLEMRSIAMIPFLTVAGPVILTARYTVARQFQESNPPY